MITIGFLLEPSVITTSPNNMTCAKSKKLLILQWIVLAFLLSAAYRSVLLATIVTPAYEESIENLDDLLRTTKQILVPEGTKTSKLLRKDPKADIETLHKKVEFYNKVDGKHPQSVLEGYENQRLISICVLILLNLLCRSLQNKIVRLGPRDDKYLYGNYLGQDRLFSYPYSYLIPKASPLKVKK